MIVEKFGNTKTGQEVFKYVLENENGMRLSLINLGATITSLEVLDREGTKRDVVLGYDTAEDYQKNTYYFGAVIGRNANRIQNAVCVIDRVKYLLEQNDHENNLHSGSRGFHDVLWKADYDTDRSDKLVFEYISPDGEQGFPGNLTARVTYELTKQNEVILTYDAITDKKTVANFTNHAYYNLDGHDAGTIEKQELCIKATYYTPVVDEKAIPTGGINSVSGTPMDFREEKHIGRDIGSKFEQLVFAGGYDHNYVLDQESDTMRLAATAKSENSGIVMRIYTDCPGIQFYSGNFIQEHSGKNGTVYGKRQGFCLETQYFPNAVNQPGFESPLLVPGKVYHSQTKMCFDLR